MGSVLTENSLCPFLLIFLGQNPAVGLLAHHVCVYSMLYIPVGTAPVAEVCPITAWQGCLSVLFLLL